MSCKQARPLAAATFFAAIFSVAVFDASNSNADAAPLFDPATAAEMRAAPPSVGTMREGLRGASPGALRNRLVSLNTTELARIVPVGLDNARSRLDRARTLSRAVTLDLFPGVRVTAERTDIEAPAEGGYIWAGEANGNQPSFVTLVINKNAVLGHIETGGRLYSIEPVSGRLHRIIEIDESKIPKDMHVPLPAGAIQKKSEAVEPPAEAEAADAGTVTNIRVLVANTVNARAECLAGGTVAQDRNCMQDRINLAIFLANKAFGRSGVLIKFVRVGGQTEVAYDDVRIYGKGSYKNYEGPLCDLSNIGCGFNNQSAKFDTVHAKRDTFAADLVILMRRAGVACGIAWVPDPPTSATSIYGFSVVTSTNSYKCIEGHTFAHETGHIMGLNHDRYVEPPARNSEFNYGYVDSAPAGRFREIMSYPDKCADLGVNCRRIPYFSTPLELYNGRKIGIPRNKPGAADGARWLNTTRTTVGSYR